MDHKQEKSAQLVCVRNDTNWLVRIEVELLTDGNMEHLIASKAEMPIEYSTV